MFGRAIVACMTAAAVGGAPAVAAAADQAERAEALLLGSAINRFAAKQLPWTFAVRGDRAAGIGAQDLTMIDLRFCGAGRDASHGRFIGVIRPAEASAPGPASLEEGDCRAKLDKVARRLASAPDAAAIAVVEVVVDWAPSALHVNVGDVATAGDGGRALEKTLARAKAAGELGAADTSGLRLTTPRGSGLDFDVALSFPKGVDGVLATVTPACAGCVPAAPKSPSILRGTPPPDSDGAVAATLPLANRVVSLYSADGPLELAVDRETVEIRGVQISGGEGALAVRGRATARTIAESALVRLESSGADLRLSDVRADPELEDCSALSGAASIKCNVRNTARGPAAAAIAAAISSRYRGQLLRTLIAPPPFSFAVGGRTLLLQLAPTRAAAVNGAIVVHGKATVE
jgi:hypothetical protein